MTLTFNNSLPVEDAFIKTDREKLFAILTNLVKNAIKYSDKGSIDFGYIHKNACFEFYVKDTGIGIDKDQQEAIFKHFVQEDISDKDARQGAGLGLSISRAYVEMLGGNLNVESEKGKGSTFHFTIPCDSKFQESSNGLNETNFKELDKRIRDLKILIVEDHEESALLLRILLRRINREILYARNGYEAIDICRNNPDLDLIFMDIKMPEMDGYEATRMIRKFNDEVVIISQTAFALSGDEEKGIEVGCNGYLTKPIKKKELMSLIQRFLGKKQEVFSQID